MGLGEIILAIILFIISFVLAILGVRQLRCKGYCLNNAYIYASKQERDQMYLRPYYMQSGTVFLMASGLFALNCLRVIFKINVLFYISIALLVGIVLFAIISSVLIEKKK